MSIRQNEASDKYVMKSVYDALRKIINQLKPQHQALSFTILTGRSQQGMSTLLRQSQLESVPIEADGIHLYFNHHGIMLELGESWVNQSQPLLQYTLKQINRCHRLLKVTGLLFCIDINELLTAHLSDLPALLKAHTAFINKFVTDLGYPTSIAILFTKLDLITGFCDFFQHDHDLDLNKPLGFSLHERTPSTQLPEQFKSQFNHLIESLEQQVINKIHPVRSSIKRTLIREFPLQLANSRHILLPLIQSLPSKLARLEAIYFTSGEQGGVCVDRLNKKIQQEYALTLQNQIHQSTNYRTYFIDGALLLFQQQTKRAVLRESPSHQTVAASLLICTLLGIIWIGHQYFNSSQLLDKASQALIAFDSLNQSKHRQDLATYHLAKASKALDTLQSNVVLMPTIQTIKVKLRQNTAQYLSHQVLPKLLQDLEKTLADTKLSPIERYQALKIYLMLDKTTVKSEHFSEQEILAWFKQHWQHQASPSEIRQKIALLEHVLHHSRQSISINKQVITDTRNFLNALPVSYLYYALAKAQFPQETLPLKLKGFTLPANQMPVYLTKAGFISMMAQLPSIVQALKQENWILARQDLNDLPILLQQAYCFEYVIWWQHFIQGIHPTHTQDYQQVTKLLKTIQQANTMNALVLLIQKQTSPSTGQDASLFNQEIASKFSELNLMSHSSLEHLTLSFTELEKFLDTLSIVNDQGKTAFNFTKARFQGDALANPLSALYNQSKQLPEPVSTWAKQIADDAWFALINHSRAYLNQQWQAQVFRDYQMQIANRYPFDITKTDEITISDFNAFFSPHGKLNRFIETYLKPFLDTSKPQWQLKEMNNYVLPISSDMINELIRANVITNMFFPDQSDSCQVEFSLQKVSLDPIVASLQLTMGDTKLKDTQGSDSYTEFRWPQSNARLVVNSIEGQQYEIEELGSWAFFKILQKVNVLVDEQDSSNLQILFEINGNSGRYLLKAQNPVNPFIPGILNEFNLADVIA